MPTQSKRSAAAQRLGKLGGKARAAALTPERRREIARAGAAVTNAKRAAKLAEAKSSES